MSDKSKYPKHKSISDLEQLESITSNDNLLVHTKDGKTGKMQFKNLIVGLANISFGSIISALRTDTDSNTSNTSSNTSRIVALESQLASLGNTVGFVNVAGAIVAVAGSVPAGWLECDGRAVSRITYSRLFAAIGTTYGPGDNTTSFNLPDLRGRVIVQEDKGAGRIQGATLAAAGGSETQTLTVEQIPPHSHLTKKTDSGSGFAGFGLDIAVRTNTDRGGGDNVEGRIIDGVNLLTDTGGGEPHRVLQPYLVLRYAIRT